jgi:predicted nuclease of predicted toxin-antitoxin system
MEPDSISITRLPAGERMNVYWATLIGPPPKVIWLRCGNQPTENVERLLREYVRVIMAFESDVAACLEIY